MTTDSVVRRPDIKLEDIRYKRGANSIRGRGTETAAGRGYNTERLAGAVLGKYKFFCLDGVENNWFDTVAAGDQNDVFVECKSCVYRYPSGPYGRFRIWRKNHTELLESDELSSNYDHLYFFVVYDIEDGIETEVGKLVVPAEEVDQSLNSWSTRDHESMGKEKARDISWNMLLNKLGVSREIFREENTLDLTTSDSQEG